MSFTPSSGSGSAHDRFVSKLVGMQLEGSGNSWQCPAHQDEHASLTVTPGAGKVLFFCHAQCPAEAVLKAMDFTWHDVYDDAEETAYDYQSEEGAVLFQKVRRPGKQFFQRHQSEDGSWVNDLKGVRRVLYHLPLVIDAVATGKKIYLVEGEKDAESVMAADSTVIATTNPEGAAGKWHPDYTQALKGGDIRVVADRDLPGIEHAERTARELRLVAKGGRVDILLPAEGKDVSDHLAAGLSLSELRPYTPEKQLSLGDAGPEVQEVPNDLDGWLEAGPDWLASAESDVAGAIIPGVLASGGIGFIGGEPKVGKTWLVIELILCVASGKPLFGQYPVEQPGRVLLIASEGNKSKVQQRIRSMALGKKLEPAEALRSVDLIWRRALQLDVIAHLDWLIGVVERREYRLIIVDVLRDLWSGEENVNDQAAALMKQIRRITNLGPTVLLVQHFAKSNADTAMKRPGQRLRGASVFHAALDSGIYLERGRTSRATEVDLESKDEAAAAPFRFSWPREPVDGSKLAWLAWEDSARRDDAIRETLEAVVAHVRLMPGMTSTALVVALKRRREDVFAAINQAKAQGLIHTEATAKTNSKGEERKIQGLYLGREPVQLHGEVPGAPGPAPAQPVPDELSAQDATGSGNLPELEGTGSDLGAGGAEDGGSHASIGREPPSRRAPGDGADEEVVFGADF